MKDIVTEVDAIKQKSQKCVKELRGLSNFFKIFTQTYQEEVTIFKNKLSEHEEKYQLIDDSILSANLVGIYDCFRQYNDNTKKLMTKINNELISPYDVFRNTQFTIYQNNINELREVNKIYQESKDLLEMAQLNYYQACDVVKKENQDKKFYVSKKEISNYDINVQNKMKAKNLEMIYKFELEKYNKSVSDINDRYNKIHDKIQLADKSRIMFIKTSFDKYRSYMEEYIKNIKDFLKVVENYISDDICTKDEKHNLEKFAKFKKKNFAEQEKFISFNEFIEKEKKNKSEKEILKYQMVPSELKVMKTEEKEVLDFLKSLSNDFLSENEVSVDKIAKLIELFQFKDNNSDIEKKFMDSILEKRKISSIRFYNLKNLEHLATVLSYITFKENSIFEGNFELNFKIIFIAERIFYQNKINNNKVYLSALLSKNKYYRTKTFWKNVMELKLANKLQDHILRLKNYILPEEKNKGFFKMISGKILSGDPHKNSLIGKSHIVPLLKDYNNLEPTRVEIMDKMAIQEMTLIIKNSIPNFANFNFQADRCMDLIVEIVQEYKVPNDNINYYVTYSNICGHTIRKLLPHEKDLLQNTNSNKTNNNNEQIKLAKVFENTIPYLSYQDYNNLLLISKFYNKKIKKKIYKYILKQKNTKKEIRLKIWSNLLKLNQIKKEYDYQQILTTKNDEKAKYEIKLDVDRTAVNKDNKEMHREKISNVLFAVSQCNGDIKYCQGMNFIVGILYEMYGEEEAFYIFLSFFKNTEYPLIFAKDLKKLKVFFYVFNRIIQLLEPELSSYLNMHNVTVNTFMPPWFITLFTSSHQYLRDEHDNMDIVLRILDNFIVSGWKGMMTLGIALLHNFENTIMNKKYEAMMEFLINDILKSEFFENKNKDKLEEYFQTIKISKNLIKNIELEFAQDEKLNEVSKQK
jgi:hypothetical protein